MKIRYTQKEFSLGSNETELKLQCYQCGCIFLRTKKKVVQVLSERCKARRSNKFCSLICSHAHREVKVSLTCKECGVITQKTPSEVKKSKNHFCGSSCSATYGNTHKTHGTRRSKLEAWLEVELIKLYPNGDILFNQKSSINSELDIHFVDLNLAFELNGIFHYEPIFGEDKLNKIQNNDHRKFQACLENGIELCIIDSSGQKYFKESSSVKYLNIIKEVVDERIKVMNSK